jgi:hypothetical protein
VIAAAALLLASKKYAKDHNQPLHLPDMPNGKGEMRPWFESLNLGVTIHDLDGTFPETDAMLTFSGRLQCADSRPLRGFCPRQPAR